MRFRSFRPHAGLVALGISVFCLTAPMVASAGSFESTGTATGQSKNTPHPVAEGHVLMQMHTEYDGFDMADTSNPLHGAAGPCFGSLEIAAGRISGGGLCRLTDTAGEHAVIRWQSERLDAEGQNHGVWMVLGGTGKWAGASGGGRFAAKADPETGTTTNQLSGAVSLP